MTPEERHSRFTESLCIGIANDCLVVVDEVPERAGLVERLLGDVGRFKYLTVYCMFDF